MQIHNKIISYAFLIIFGFSSFHLIAMKRVARFQEMGRREEGQGEMSFYGCEYCYRYSFNSEVGSWIRASFLRDGVEMFEVEFHGDQIEMLANLLVLRKNKGLQSLLMYLEEAEILEEIGEHVTGIEIDIEEIIKLFRKLFEEARRIIAEGEEV